MRIEGQTFNYGYYEHSAQHRRRIEGESGYTIAGLIGLWINGFTAFSVKPLRAATFIGVVVFNKIQRTFMDTV